MFVFEWITNEANILSWMEKFNSWWVNVCCQVLNFPRNLRNLSYMECPSCVEECRAEYNPTLIEVA